MGCIGIAFFIPNVIFYRMDGIGKRGVRLSPFVVCSYFTVIPRSMSKKEQIEIELLNFNKKPTTYQSNNLRLN